MAVLSQCKRCLLFGSQCKDAVGGHGGILRIRYNLSAGCIRRCFEFQRAGDITAAPAEKIRVPLPLSHKRIIAPVGDPAVVQQKAVCNV